MDVKDIAEKYRRHVSPGLLRLLKFSGYEHVEDTGEGAVVRDTEGKEYIDCGGGYGVFTLGHRHPSVVAAVREQLERLPLSPRVFLSQPLAEAAEALAAVAPGDLQYVFFCNSGAEAIEGAIKLARLATGRPEIISASGAFHGKTLGALSGSGRDVYKDPFRPLVPDCRQVDFGDAEALAEAVGERTAAVLLEPVQGEAGILIPPEGYLRRAREICDAAGALLILDEVQTGLGRTGRMFACEHFGVAPDIMCLAKALGGGVMPVGAFLGTPAVWRVFESNPLIHTSTFGGNPLACVAVKAAVQATVDERIPERAAELGGYLMRCLRELAARYPSYVAEVRGLGLMVGLEFTHQGVGGIVFPAMARDGVTAIYTLNNPSVMRLEPPAGITREQIDYVVEALDRALAEVSTKYAHLFRDKAGQPAAAPGLSDSPKEEVAHAAG